jgi:hypothetical protein
MYNAGSKFLNSRQKPSAPNVWRDLKAALRTRISSNKTSEFICAFDDFGNLTWNNCRLFYKLACLIPNEK